MKKYLLIIAALTLSSCMQKALEKVIPQKGYKQEKVSQTKTVAIVAFDILKFRPTGLGSKVVGQLATAQMAQNLQPAEDPFANKTYGYLEEQLRTQKNFRVISLKSVLENPTYKRIYELRKDSAQAKLTGNQFQKPLFINGLLRPVNPEYLLKEEDIKALKAALKVDALVMASLSYWTQQNDYTGLGIAKIYLRTQWRFHVFDAGSSEKIWFHNGFEGPVSDDSIGRISGSEDSNKIEGLIRPLATQTIDSFLKFNQYE